MKHELISYISSPYVPAPLNSSDEGEAWVWGDYFAVLQTNPQAVFDLVSSKNNRCSNDSFSLKYHFALSVYYQISKSPFGMTTRPLLIAALVSVDEESGTVLRLIRPSLNLNLGVFQGNLNKERARECLFKAISHALSLEGQPVKIGAINDIHGHPNTGWPVKKIKKRAGCMSAILLFLFPLISILVTQAFRIKKLDLQRETIHERFQATNEHPTHTPSPLHAHN